ncbi:MAG TPA: Nramp family divalent metal transporter [Longimicrobiales bacterium]
MAVDTMTSSLIQTPPESASGLPAWKPAELPDPPRPRGLAWLGVVGPGIIVLGVSIGSGEFLLGPAAFVRYGATLLWVTSVAVFLQTVFNTEVMRYTLATGEPAFTGFMRTRPSSTFWAWVYSVLYFLQSGWPAWAATAAGALFFLVTRRLPTTVDAGVIQMIGSGTFLLCIGILLVGRRIERTLEILNWIMVGVVLCVLLMLALLFASGDAWLSIAAGYVGYDVDAARFNLLPQGADFVLLAAFAGYCGAGGVSNITLSNWARDKGYGMSKHAGYIPAAIGGKKVNLAHTGFRFTPDAESLERWRGWWRIVRADQWGIFFLGAILGMGLPAVLYLTFLTHGADIRGLGIAGALAEAMRNSAGAFVGGIVAFIGVWVLFKTQLDILEGMVRAITDMLWTGSERVRAWRGGDVRIVYYGVLTVVVVWGLIALRMRPVTLLQMGANVASAVFVIASLHLLYVNTRLLPAALRPPAWRRASLVIMALFYGSFVVLSISNLLNRS